MIPNYIEVYDTSILNRDITPEDRQQIDALEYAILVLYRATNFWNGNLDKAIYLITDELAEIAQRYMIPKERLYCRMDMRGIWWSVPPGTSLVRWTRWEVRGR